MTGAGFIDWVNKHKKKIGIGAMTVASVAGLAYKGYQNKLDNEPKKLEKNKIIYKDNDKLLINSDPTPYTQSQIRSTTNIKTPEFNPFQSVSDYIKQDPLKVRGEGAGLTKLVKSTYDLFNPQAWKKTIHNWKNNLRRKEELNSEEKIKAHMANESYKPYVDRKDIGNYQYIKEDSGHNYTVYRNSNTKKNILAFKGTSDLEDIIPDLTITGGIQDYNNKFIEANTIYNTLKQKYDGEWETVGHSLGGTKAMWVAQQNNIPSHAFNPGYVSITDDRINPEYKNHNVYLVKGDPISNTILGEKLENVKVMDSPSLNPIVNHSITNFTN